MGVTLLALLPTLLLARIEQRAKARGEAVVATSADEPLLEAA
jgi:hypothetical protein